MRHKSFNPDRNAVFSARPNRFVVLALSDDEELKVHCPNPGRLREILQEGRNLILERSNNPGRKTLWTLAAAEYKGLTIPLVSAQANKLVGDLILPEFFSGYMPFPEKTYGGSRFDWYLEKDSSRAWVEVKACTLVEHGRALFPDAPSVRARKHTEELISIKDGSSREIIFAVMNPTAAIFSPNPHTDPDLCLSLMKAHLKGVKIRAVSFRTNNKGWTQVENSDLPIDLSSVNLIHGDSGIVVRILEQTGKHLSWTIRVDRHKTEFGKSIRRQLKKAGKPGADYRQVVAFPIYGQLTCFDSIENELAELSDSGEGYPAADPALLDLILDYRHRRVFNV